MPVVPLVARGIRRWIMVAGNLVSLVGIRVLVISIGRRHIWLRIKGRIVIVFCMFTRVLLVLKVISLVIWVSVQVEVW
jgi:hypothetical protein